MRKLLDYTVVYMGTHELMRFREKVCALANHGYELAGGLCISGDYMYQAMAIYEKPACPATSTPTT